ncbi:MAG: hypothetical protein JWP89_4055 [Schlesneria sp.]|nr:hypothetical protein [Schlesneria sp.]
MFTITLSSRDDRLPAFPVYIVGGAPGSPSLVAIKHKHDGRIGIPVFSSPDDAGKLRNAAAKNPDGIKRQHSIEQINSLDRLFNRIRELQTWSQISSIVVNPKPRSFVIADWIPIAELEGPTALPSSPN